MPATSLKPSPQSTADNDNSPVPRNRAKIVESIGAHLSGGPKSWETLPFLLSTIMQGQRPEDLFTEDKLTPPKGTYTKTMESLHGRPDFHISFFAFATGAATPIHDHKVNCVSYVIKGPLTEVLYNKYGDLAKGYMTTIRPTGSIVSDIVKSGPKFIHSVENNSKEMLYSMHIYNCKQGDSPNSTIYNSSHAKL